MLFPSMNPWFAKAVVLLSSVVMILIRAPHGQRSRKVKVVKSRKGPLETVLLTVAWVAFFVPLVWVATPALAFADHPLRLAPLFSGSPWLALGLWLFSRSHLDLGTNGSITLEVRDKHQLITQGAYRHVRHPLCLALLLYSLGQGLALPNRVAGPSYGLAMALLVTVRMGPEARMMLDEFGKDYEARRARTKRLISGVW